jgi:L-asparaginase
MTKALNKKTNIVVITTGGTIDKSYDEFQGSLSNRETQLKRLILSKLRLPYTNLDVISVLSKDSLHMTDYDRNLITKTIEGQLSKGDPIVVLHGTDTMAKSAEFVELKIRENLDVPVIFTGAMKPMGFTDSDANQNVTEALLASKMLQAGVYISFHNRIFKVPGVSKNHQTGTFELV